MCSRLFSFQVCRSSPLRVGTSVTEGWTNSGVDMRYLKFPVTQVTKYLKETVHLQPRKEKCPR